MLAGWSCFDWVGRFFLFVFVTLGLNSLCLSPGERDEIPSLARSRPLPALKVVLEKLLA